MKKTLLIYHSKTGFTKKYADWLIEEIGCEHKVYHELKPNDLVSYDLIIYGAGVHAGRIHQFKAFKKLFDDASGKELFVFATGAAPHMESNYQDLLKRNFSESERSTYRFYYFQSGLNYEEMSFTDRLLMKSYYNVLSLKKVKTDIDKNTIHALKASHDLSRKAYIKPLLDDLKSTS